MVTIQMEKRIKNVISTIFFDWKIKNFKPMEFNSIAKFAGYESTYVIRDSMRVLTRTKSIFKQRNKYCCDVGNYSRLLFDLTKVKIERGIVL